MADDSKPLDRVGTDITSHHETINPDHNMKDDGLQKDGMQHEASVNLPYDIDTKCVGNTTRSDEVQKEGV